MGDVFLWLVGIMTFVAVVAIVVVDSVRGRRSRRGEKGERVSAGAGIRKGQMLERDGGGGVRPYRGRK